MSNLQSGSIRASKAKRIDSILEAATAQFYEVGFMQTGMADIAASVGISPSALYKHVESKQALLQRIVLTDIETLIHDFVTVTNTTTNAMERLRRGAEAHVRHHAKYARQSHIGMGELNSLDEKIRRQYIGRRRAYSKMWHDLIDYGIVARAFSPVDPRITVFSIIDMGIGVARWFHPDGPISVDSLAVSYGDIAVRIVTDPEPVHETASDT